MKTLKIVGKKLLISFVIFSFVFSSSGLGFLEINVAHAAMNGLTFAPSGSPVGAFMSADDIITTFTVSQEYSTPPTLVLDFPEGTILNADNISQSDFLIVQESIETSEHPESVLVSGTSLSLEYIRELYPSGGYGPIVIQLSDTATGNEIQFPTITTTTGTFGLSTADFEGDISDVVFVADDATHVRVEIAADGGDGTVVPEQTIFIGDDDLTVYAITRDQYGNFIENVSPDSWSLEGDVIGDLVPDVTTNKFAVFTADTVGAATIRAAKSGLTSTDSGTITVEEMAPDFDFAGGTGTAEDPYQIEDCQQLQNMSTELDADYVLIGDIDCSAATGWNESDLVAGVSLTLVEGTTYATGYTHLTELTVYEDGFELEGGAVDYSANLEAGNIIFMLPPEGVVTADLKYSKGFNPIGNPNDTPATYFSGTFDGNGYVISDLYMHRTSPALAGGTGLFGETHGATISNVGLEDVEITGVDWAVGTLVGFSYNNTSISNTYATGSVTGANRLGGLVGANQGGSTIVNSYSAVVVNVRDGGGQGVGGLVGYEDGGGSVTNSFWDTDMSGLMNSADGVGKTTVEMSGADTFTDWDFAAVWRDPEGVGYPTLRRVHGIATCQELQDITLTYSGGTASEDVYKLMDDIDCLTVNDGEENEGVFTPIGLFQDDTDTHIFNGVLDGDNHTISNLNIYLDDADAVGMFEQAIYPTFKDLTLDGGSVGGDSSGAYFGALVGQIESMAETDTGITIGNVHSNLDITSSNISGGFVGEMYGNSASQITNSSVSGDIDGEAGTGGFIGNVSFDGCLEETDFDISTSYMDGNISSASNDVGGMIGKAVFDDDTCDVSISESYTSGSVTGDESVGGFVGMIYNSDGYTDTGVLIFNAYSISDVSGVYNIGGILGYNYASELNIENSYFGGTVTGTDPEDSANIGGMVGSDYVGTDTATNSFVAATITNENVDNTGFFIGFTEAVGIGDGDLDGFYYYDDGSIWLVVGNDDSVQASSNADLSYFKPASYDVASPPIGSWDFEGPKWVVTEGYFPTLMAIAADDLIAIDFEEPTPADESTLDVTTAEISVSTNSTAQHYVVNDFDDSLLGWWRGENNGSDDSSFGNHAGYEADYEHIDLETLVELSPGSATASNTYQPSTYGPEIAFDGDEDTFWWCDGDLQNHNGPTQWLAIDLGEGNDEIVTASRLHYSTHENDTLTTSLIGRIQGSNDNTNWTDLRDFSHGDANAWYLDYLDNSNSYRYYRLFIDSSVPAVNWPRIDEWQLYTGVESENYVSGKFGQAFSLDGGNHVDVTDNPSLQVTGDFTISAWVNSDSASTGSAIKRIIGYADVAGSYDLDWDHNGLGGTSFSIYNGASWFAAVTTLNASQWYHLVGVYNGTSVKLYVDGVLVDQSETIDTINSADGSITIGADSIGGSNFSGLVDDVAIFNRALSAAEIASLYDASENQYGQTFNDLADGEHTMTAYAVDLGGNKVSTGERTFSVAEETYDSWNTFYGSAAEDRPYQIVKDNEGNSYIVGRSKNTWNSHGETGTEPLNTHSSSGNAADIFVLKLDSDGRYLWHTFYGGDSYDYGFSAAVDTDNNLYITGFSYSLWDGPEPDSEDPLNAFTAGDSDSFVLKLNSDGDYQWHTFYGSDFMDEGQGIVVDGSGNVYVAIKSYYTWNGADAEGPLHPYSSGEDSGSQTDMAILKLDTDGNYLWHTFYGSDAYVDEDNPGDEPTSIAVDGDANVYVGGFSIDSWTGSDGEEPLNGFTESDNDAFILKLDTDGGYQWHTFYGSTEQDWINSIHVQAGYLYATGFSGASWAGPEDSASLHPYSGGDDIMVVKLDDSGTYQWHTFYGSESDDYGLGMAIDDSSVIYVTGRSLDTWLGDGDSAPLNDYVGAADIMILKLNDSGDYQGHTFYGSEAEDNGQSIVVDADDNAYVAGYSNGTWQIVDDQNPLNTYSANKDIVVIKTVLNWAGSLFAGGAGTELSPWQIETCEQLQAIDSDADYLDDYFVLTEDIDCSMTNPDDDDYDDGGIWGDEAGFDPIGYCDYGDGCNNNPEYFTGSFDGNRHKITGLYINRHGEGFNADAALFAAIGSGEADYAVYELGLENVNISGDNHSAGLATYIDNDASVNLVYVTGAVESIDYAGGLVGRNNGNIYQSFSDVEVESTEGEAGGFVANNSGNISDCYATGNVTGYEYTGGFAAENDGAIYYSYSTGDVLGSDEGNSDYLAGFISYDDGDVYYSFSTGEVSSLYEDAEYLAGFIAESYGNDYSSNRWFNSLDDGVLGAGAIEYEPEKVNGINDFKGNYENAPIDEWDFDEIWDVAVGAYPTLRGIDADNIYSISSCEQLQEMAEDLSGHYVLIQNIDCSDTDEWNDVDGICLGDSDYDNQVDCEDNYYEWYAEEGGMFLGFSPIGCNQTSNNCGDRDDDGRDGFLEDDFFTGSLEGENGEGGNYEIQNLYVNRGEAQLGLFGIIGDGAQISNVDIVDASIEAHGESEYIGILAGYISTGSTIDNVNVSGSVVAEDSDYVGGLGGYHDIPDVCFLAGTQILLEDGSYKNIENVKTGDWVQSFNEISGQKVFGQVAQIFIHETDQYLIINDSLKLTPNHPLYVNGEWLEAGSIVVGDLLRGENGENIEVYSIQGVYDSVPVYNLEVKPENEGELTCGPGHSYYADGILAHNKCPIISTDNGNGYEFNAKLNVYNNGKAGEGAFHYKLDSFTNSIVKMSYDPTERNIDYVDYIAIKITDTNGVDTMTHLLEPVSCTGGGCDLSLLKEVDEKYLVLSENNTAVDLDFGTLPILPNGYERSFEVISNGYHDALEHVALAQYPNDIQKWFREYYYFTHPGTHHTITNSSADEIAVSGDEYVGGLLGYNAGTVTDSFSVGTVSGLNVIGGFVGYNDGEITTSYSIGAVTGGFRLGGFAGQNYNNISESYSNDSVTNTGDSWGTGGFAGFNYTGAAITNCYATGDVSGHNSSGGFVGYNEGDVYTSYASGDVEITEFASDAGGFVGMNGGDSVYSSFSTGSVTASFGGFDGVFAGRSYPTYGYGIYNSGYVAQGEDPAVGYSDGEYDPLYEEEDESAFYNTEHEVYTDGVYVWDFDEGEGVWYTDGSHLPTLMAIAAGDPQPSFDSGDGLSEDTAYHISTCQQLQAMNTDLDAYYYLDPEGDILDCSITNWEDEDFDPDTWDESGFEPIGTLNAPFTGQFDGNRKTIDGLYINRADTDYVGLFGVVQVGEGEDTGVVQYVSLTDVYVSGFYRVGGLIGKMFTGTEVVSANVEGSIYGTNYVGGLVGGSLGSITTSETNVIVEGGNYVGGMVGALSGTEGEYNQGYILASGSSGEVHGGSEETGGLVGVTTQYSYVSQSSSSARVTGDWTVGGLIGTAQGNVSNSGATGEVTAQYYGAGGLIGYLDGGEVRASYATGPVSAGEDSYELDAPSSYAGGLVGMSNNGDIYESYATGDVYGTSLRVGGLVGGTNSLVQDCYATGDVTAGDAGNWYLGGERAGGLVGGLSGEVVNSYATGAVQGNKFVGGLVGIDLSGEISYSFSTGVTTAAGNSPEYVGAFIGLGVDADYGALYNYYLSSELAPVGDGRLTDDPIVEETVSYFQGLDVASRSPFVDNWVFTGEDQAWRAFDGLYPTLEAITADDPFTVSFVTPPTPVDEATLPSNEAEIQVEVTGAGFDYYVANDFDQSLVGWWRGEGNAYDDSSFEAEGLASDGVGYIEGKYGEAFDFEQSYVDITTESLPTGTDPVTISLWFNTDYCDNTYLFVYGTEADNSQRALICQDSGSVIFSGYGADHTGYGVDPQDGEWHHLVGVYDGQAVSLYFDGSILINNEEEPNWDTEMSGARIGSSLTGWGPINGGVDDVLVFNRALSFNEVRSLYNADQYSYDITFEDLPVDDHTIIAYVVNSSGDMLATEERRFTSSESNIQNPVETILDENQFHGGGVAQEWNDNDNVWTYDLPFSFNFYGVDYDTVYVSSNGYMAFEDPDNEYDFAVEYGIGVPVIVAMSGDLCTDCNDGEDIYVTSNEEGQVIFRWQASDLDDAAIQLNFEIVLHDDNTFELNYGEMPYDLSQEASVGVNDGDDMYVLSEYSDLDNFNLLDTSAWDWPGGVEDVYVDDDWTEGENSCDGDWVVDCFNDITDALAAVAEDGTVYVSAGFYSEDEMIEVSTAGITIQGVGFEDITDPSNDSASESIITVCNDNVIDITADNVTLTGLNIRNYCDGEATYSDTVVDASADGDIVTGNVLQGGNTGVLFGDAIADIEVTDNYIYDNLFGVSDYGALGATISDNVIAQNSLYGIAFITMGTAEVGETVVNDNEIYYDGDNEAIGIYYSLGNQVYNEEGEYDNSLTIGPSNNIYGNYEGVYVYGPAYGVSINGNQITDSLAPESALHAEGVYTGLDVRENWWGDETGPTIASNPLGVGDVISIDSDEEYEYPSQFISYRPFCIVEDCSELSSLEVDLGESEDGSISTLFDNGGTMSIPDGSIDETTQVDVDEDTSIIIPIDETNDTIIYLPAGTVITKSDVSETDTFTPADMSALEMIADEFAGFDSDQEAVSAVQWGIPALGLEFDPAITIYMYVGTDKSGDTLDVRRSLSLDGGWTTEGLIGVNGADDGTCIVDDEGICEFQTTLASYFIVLGNVTVAGGGGGSGNMYSNHQCDDGKDNDGDGKIDMSDSGCATWFDDSETNVPVVEQPGTTYAGGFKVGDLIKVKEFSSVYQVGEKGVRHPFMDEGSYYSYYKDFSKVKTTTLDILAEYPMSSPMPYNAGSLIKLKSIPKVFLVEAPNVIRWITTEQLFTARGYKFNQIHDVSDAFWGVYRRGDDIVK